MKFDLSLAEDFSDIHANNSHQTQTDYGWTAFGISWIDKRKHEINEIIQNWLIEFENTSLLVCFVHTHIYIHVH